MSEAEENPFAGTEPPGGTDYGEFKFRAKRWVIGTLADVALTAVPGSAAVPVLGCFRVRVGEGFLELAATDMERTVLAVSEAVDAQDTPEGVPYEVFLPARKFHAILKEAPDGEVAVTVRKNEAAVTVSGSTWQLRLPPPGDYPELADPGQLQFSQYSREKFLAAIRAVRHVVGRDAGRPALTQVDIRNPDMSEGGTCMTASDGSRFARAALPGFPHEMCIPASILDDLVRVLSAAKSDDTGVAVTADRLFFKAGPVILAVARRVAPFPDMDRLLLRPALEGTEQLILDRDELLAAVRRVRINASTETSAILLEVSGSTVTAIARDKAGNGAREDVPVTWKGEDRALCVNHVYLGEMLTANPGKAAVIRLRKDHGKKRSMVLLEGEGLVQVIAQMTPELVGY